MARPVWVALLCWQVPVQVKKDSGQVFRDQVRRRLDLRGGDAGDCRDTGGGPGAAAFGEARIPDGR
jgi:hypothetical protein